MGYQILFLDRESVQWFGRWRGRRQSVVTPSTGSVWKYPIVVRVRRKNCSTPPLKKKGMSPAPDIGFVSVRIYE